MGPENLPSREFMQDRARRSKVGQRVHMVTDFKAKITGAVIRNDDESDYVVVRDETQADRQLAVTTDCIASFRPALRPDPFFNAGDALGGVPTP